MCLSRYRAWYSAPVSRCSGRLGTHCMEVDYQRALQMALAKRELECIREAEIPICSMASRSRGGAVGFVVWDDRSTLLLEIKAAKKCARRLRAVSPLPAHGNSASASWQTSAKSRWASVGSFTPPPPRPSTVRTSNPSCSSRFAFFAPLRDFVFQNSLDAATPSGAIIVM